MASVVLLLSEAPVTGSPVNLLFGPDAPAAPATVDLYLAGEMPRPGLQVAMLCEVITSAQVSGVLPQPALTALLDVRQTYRAEAAGILPVAPLTASLSITYDNRVTRWLGQPVAAHQQKAAPEFVEAGSAWRVSLLRRDATALPWQQAQAAGIALALPFAPAAPRRPALALPWQTALQCHRQAAAAHQKAVLHSIQRSTGWQLADRRAIEAAARLQTGLWRDLRRAGGWSMAAAQVRNLSALSGASLRLVGVQFMGAPWQTAKQPRNGRSVRPVVPSTGTHYVPSTHLIFDTPWSNSTALVFGRDQATGLSARVVVAIKRIYMVLNEVSLRRVDGNIALPTSAMSLNLDADSWAWGFSASLPGSVLQDLEPGNDGAPVELEALVNGTAFRVLVEGITRQRTFGKSDINLSGRGKTALLDGPYAPVQNFSNASGARTAQQLMADVLSVNGVPMDWVIDWQLDDWLVPAGVFTHQGSYISALNAIAAAAGGYIQPHAALQTIRVLPRYPSAPWDWPALEQAGTLIPDFELPAAVTTREGIEWVERARYNRVYVSGQQGGRLGRVTRAGTAGDLLAPMVVDPLITDAIAARQRGLSVLGNTGRQANITLGLPVLPETGVILPGSMGRYVDAGVSRLGIARGVSLSVGFPEVWQSIGVETHV